MSNGGGGKGGTQQPSSTAAPATPNAYQQSAGLMGQAGNQYGQAAGLNTANLGRAMGDTGLNNYQNYMSPYTQQVIDQSLNDINRQREIAQVQNQGNAALSGAFGGARQGLVEAETNRGAMDAMGRTAADLRNQGFMNSFGLAQNDIQNRQGAFNDYFGNALAGGQAQENLGGNYFGVGKTLNQQQQQSGLIQQALMQQILDQGQGMFQGFTQSPQDVYKMRLEALGMSPLSNASTTNQTSSTSPLGIAGGLLSAGSNMFKFGFGG